MKLRKFRVTNFRSVDDSGWIDVDDVTALIGTNESGKTNILLPLWKLNPAKEGEIVPTSDYPRKLYNQIRNQSPKPVFISAVFELPEEVCQQISEKTGMPPEVLRDVEVRRRFDRSYEVDFPNALLPRVVNRQTLESLLSEAERDIGSKNALKTEEEIKSLLVAAIQAAKASIQDMEDLGQTELENVHQLLMRVKTDGAPKSGTIAPRHVQLCNEIDALVDQVSKPHPSTTTRFHITTRFR